MRLQLASSESTTARASDVEHLSYTMREPGPKTGVRSDPSASGFPESGLVARAATAAASYGRSLSQLSFRLAACTRDDNVYYTATYDEDTTGSAARTDFRNAVQGIGQIAREPNRGLVPGSTELVDLRDQHSSSLSDDFRHSTSGINCRAESACRVYEPMHLIVPIRLVTNSACPGV